MNIAQQLRKQFHMDGSAQWKREISWLWSRVRQHKGKILLVGLLGLVGTAMGLASSVATKYLIDSVTGGDRGMLAGAAVWMIAAMLGGIVLQAVSSRVSASIHIRVKNEMQHAAYGRILRAGWESLEPYRDGDLLNRLNSDVNVVSDGTINFLPGVAASLVRFIGAFCIILYYDPIMALIALLGAPITLALSRMMMRKMRAHNLEMKELTGEVMSFQEDSFRNLTSIKAFSVTGWFEQEMRQLQQTFAGAYLAYNRFHIGMTFFLSLVSILVTTSCFGWGVYQLWNGAITYGSMTLFLQLASTLRASFSSLVSVAQQSISLMTSAGRIMAVEDLPEETQTVPEGLQEEKTLDIAIQNVSFRYRSGETVLHSFCFDAHHGDLIAVTGPSGEGKTTLLRLLLGLIEPCSGTMELVGGSGKHYPIHGGSRCMFAYVPQGNSIFSGTVAENLRLVCPDATDSQLEEVLRTACAWDFVSQFPEGLNHRLSAGGRGVSEGQAQRLAIARALLRRAPILLLDEATSALDVATEKQLLSNLRQSGHLQTCILVTHRPDSAAVCARAYEIQQGQVREAVPCTTA